MAKSTSLKLKLDIPKTRTPKVTTPKITIATPKVRKLKMPTIKFGKI